MRTVIAARCAVCKGTYKQGFRIRMISGLLGSANICTDPDLSINKQKIKKNLDFGSFVISTF